MGHGRITAHLVSGVVRRNMIILIIFPCQSGRKRGKSRLLQDDHPGKNDDHLPPKMIIYGGNMIIYGQISDSIEQNPMGFGMWDLAPRKEWIVANDHPAHQMLVADGVRTKTLRTRHYTLEKAETLTCKGVQPIKSEHQATGRKGRTLEH